MVLGSRSTRVCGLLARTATMLVLTMCSMQLSGDGTVQGFRPLKSIEEMVAGMISGNTSTADSSATNSVSSRRVPRGGPLTLQPATANTLTIPLVTGCGRAGTHSVSQYLNSIGIPAVHEGAEEGKVAVSWWYALKDAHGLPGAVDRRSDEVRESGVVFDPVVHLVRDPLDAITSLTNCLCAPGNMSKLPTWIDRNGKQKVGRGGQRWDNLSYAYAGRHIHFPPDAPRMLKAAMYWLQWNRLAAKHAKVRVRLEGLPQGGAALLLAALGVDRSHTKREVLTSALKVFGERGGTSETKRQRLSWADLTAELGEDLTNEVRAQAVAWGYDYYDFSALDLER